MPLMKVLCESRMREIRTYGLTRREAPVLPDLPYSPWLVRIPRTFFHSGATLSVFLGPLFHLGNILFDLGIAFAKVDFHVTIVHRVGLRAMVFCL